MAKYCVYCGTELKDGSFCPNCGSPIGGENRVNSTHNVSNSTAKSRLAAGLLGILLGGWGIHNFYLGYTNKAIVQIIVTLVTCGIGGLWGFIEGVLILVGNINEDANGVSFID